ncbi:hypothetical protein N0M98_11655 [Paenibacillus doosanensis]|uniref:N-acetyltransferase domain-containing protein n=1 Tax=Paenibacillus konkukensis TaxID=2020716 RepID=A0ABY4RUM5_9BACL|nr:MULTISPECIES: hypothetical protein [Paenibacillus]MCS7460800.1 hypothetical protein [Paenibacillus doosanensis]UQZ85980.1 hypothetical protein SK3146_05272 [Paenibacillus konkukensis]
MIIALENEPPAQGQFEELLATVTEDGMNAGLLYETYCQSRYVVAAYDQGRLVGLGRVTDESGTCGEYQITVLQDYQSRDIETYMRKLLSMHRL